MTRVAGLCLWLVVAGCSSSSAGLVADRSPAPSAIVVAGGGCGKTAVDKGGEPAWLTHAGANNNPKDVPYVIADPPIAAGFLFGYPLRSGTPSNPSNKILWVVDRPREGNQLAVSGHPRDAATPTTHATFPADSGPGEIYPSEVDVPSAGCWHFDLTWGANHTSVDLNYA